MRSSVYVVTKKDVNSISVGMQFFHSASRVLSHPCISPIATYDLLMHYQEDPINPLPFLLILCASFSVLSTASKIPFTKFPLFLVESSLASSIASLMVTFVGICSK